MTAIVAISNQKGGVGKTATAVNLSSALARTGSSVLLVDMDPQANATSALGFQKDLPDSVHDVLLADRPISEVATRTRVGGLDLVPSSLAMTAAELELVPLLARELKLRASLQAALEYDFIFIDCPPSLGLLTLNALVAAEFVLVPVQCEYLALEGLAQLITTIEAVRTRLNPSLSILAILLTMEDRRNRLSQQVATEVTNHFPELVARIRIPRSVRLAEAPSHGEPIDQYDPASRAANAYRRFAREIEERLMTRSPMTLAGAASK